MPIYDKKTYLTYEVRAKAWRFFFLNQVYLWYLFGLTLHWLKQSENSIARFCSNFALKICLSFIVNASRQCLGDSLSVDPGGRVKLVRLFVARLALFTESTERYKEIIRKIHINVSCLNSFWDCWKWFLESLNRLKCSSHAKNNHFRFSGSRAYPIIQPASQLASHG